jgi:flavin reductase (DIM6/NTAB) family NADH-FMN oxidoreductase RutF/DNA-binding IclR family transcriptional regulator
MSDPTDPSWFRQVLGQYPTGVCAVTAIEPDGTPTGFVVGSFTSVSLDPPLVAFFPDKSSTSWPKIEAAGKFCVNIIGADQEQLCRQFAAKGADRFEGVGWRPAVTGSPVLEGVVAWIDCELESVTEAGDHFIVVGAVKELEVGEPSLPLLFFQGGYGRFAPLSLTASNSSGALTEQLRTVDLVRHEMEALASDLKARCIATAQTQHVLAVTASAGAGNVTAAATMVGQRLPFAPPTGSAYAAFMDEDGVRDYLSLIDDEDLREEHRQRLAAVRERGYSVGLVNEAQREFVSAIDRLAADPEAMSHEDLHSMIHDLSFDPPELTPEAKRDIRSITVPVFGPDGSPALAFTLYGFPKPSSDAGIDDYIDRATEAARRATDHLGGQMGAKK